MGLSGHCLCGQVKYTVDSPPFTVAYDHCDDCQRQTGSTYSLVAVVPKDKLTISGPTKSWAGVGSPARPSTVSSAASAAPPMYHDPEAAPPNHRPQGRYPLR
ncbi:hypothetical protein NUW58_g7632 [Xylaria curta]|uniref:Uncharacterized protein n=1 Tax=Xylaria curta TaxID=42375 RepID=A0ACC1NFA4_9PEZI|nr:hypothetical protein NUW58_g7632 [Xylaria curta]